MMHVLDGQRWKHLAEIYKEGHEEKVLFLASENSTLNKKKIMLATHHYG